MEIINASDIKPVLENQLIVPLFILDSLMMPGDSMMMRVFEPRYKQMLDDVVIDSAPYGHVMANSSIPQIKGWDAPFDVGTLVEIGDLEENGSNLLYSAIAGKRFRIISLISPELENIDFGGIFPSAHDLEIEYQDKNPNGKLYLRALIEILPKLNGTVESNKWDNLIALWESYIIQIADITGFDKDDPQFIMEFNDKIKLQNDENIWRLASMVIDTLDEQVTCLKSQNTKEVVSMIESNIQKKLGLIKFFQQSNE